MDIAGIASLSTSMAETATNQAAGIAVLKKAINLESAGALALINAIPSMPNIAASSSLPVNLGQNINIAV